jgi:rhamnose transport system substrate-binding protein
MGPYLTEKYPNMSWVGGTVDKSTFYGDDDATKSTQQFNAILTQYPDVAGIISPTTVGVLAAAAEKKAKGANVKVTGLGLPSEMAPYIEDGTVEKVGLWNPIDLGYSAIYAASQFISGKATGKAGEKVSLGRVGTVTIGADGTAAMSSPFTYDATNVEKFAKFF